MCPESQSWLSGAEGALVLPGQLAGLSGELQPIEILSQRWVTFLKMMLMVVSGSHMHVYTCAPHKHTYTHVLTSPPYKHA